MDHAPKNNKGFTLAELIISMALIGILTAVLTSIIISVNKIEERSQLDSGAQSEIIRIKTALDQILKYDSSEYIFSISEQKIEISDKNADIIYKVEFSDSALNYGEKENEFSVLLSAAVNIKFKIHDDILSCKISFENTEYEHNIVYYLRAAGIEFAESSLLLEKL